MQNENLIKDKITTKNHSNDDVYLDYILQKTKKITIALHLIANLFPEEEPLRKAIKEKSICLLSDVNKVTESLKFMEVKPSVDVFKKSIYEIDVMLDVAKKIKLVSEMNYTVLKREFTAFLGDEDSFSIFGNDFFINNKINETALLKKDPKRQKEMSFKQNINNSLTKKNHKIEKNKEERRALLFNTLKKDVGISIKDISKAVKNCSEKTIQRELNSLVLNEKVKRVGTRRWARYYAV